MPERSVLAVVTKNTAKNEKGRRQSMKYLGIEFGSTRVKAVVVDESFRTVASGSHTWENKFKGGF